MRRRRQLGWLVAAGLGAGCAASPSGAEDGLPPVDPATLVRVGAARYTTALLGDEKPPSNFKGEPVRPKVTADFSGVPATNDWWSSLIWQFDREGEDNPYSEPMFAHPLALRALPAGLGLGYPRTAEVASRSYFFPYVEDLVVGLEGLQAPAAKVAGYGDFSVTAEWQAAGSAGSPGGLAASPTTLRATFGHGLPFAYFEARGPSPTARIVLGSEGTPRIFAEAPGALGVVVGDRAYGLFLPPGPGKPGKPGKPGAWRREGRVIRAALGDPAVFSVAALPDAELATFQRFARHALTFVTDTQVSWRYDQTRAEVVTTFTVKAVVHGSAAGKGGSVKPLLALYPHQWKHTTRSFLGPSYVSPRGPMKLLADDRFEIRLPFGGVLPVLPVPGGEGFDRERLADEVRAQARRDDLFPVGLDGTKGTYWTGKSLERVALLTWIADEVGETEARDRFVAALERVLEDWFDGKTPNVFYYDKTWHTLVGLPQEYRAGWELNDHHFHYGQYILAAATVARFDPAWARPDRYGAFVDLLIKDCANPDRADTRFPFLRAFDPYAGHSWANGPALFPEGNNQESSSEDANFAAAVFLWGALTGRSELRDLGIFLHAHVSTAALQYWFNVDKDVFPPGFDRPALGMLWGSGGKYDTWWDRNPIYVHGINFLPFSGGSLYLGRFPEYVRENHRALVAVNRGEPRLWRDIIWMYLALADPEHAIRQFEENPYFTTEFGHSRPFVYHWLHALRDLGQVDAAVTADAPAYAVFRRGGQRAHVAFNPGKTPLLVTFSDGVRLEVPPGKLATVRTPAKPSAEVAATASGKR